MATRAEVCSLTFITRRVRCAWEKTSRSERDKSIRSVQDTGGVKGSQRISELIGMHEKPDESNGILGAAVDEDIQSVQIVDTSTKCLSHHKP